MKINLLILNLVMLTGYFSVYAGEGCPINKVGQFVLNDSQSVTDNYKHEIWKKVQENKNANFPFAEVFNKNKNQVLKLIFHPGAKRNRFSEFELGVVNKENEKIMVLKKMDEFLIDDEIKLGDSFKKIRDKFKNLKDIKIIDGKRISYWLEDDKLKHVCLKNHKLPQYYFKMVFDNNKKLKWVRFGFEYP